MNKLLSLWPLGAAACYVLNDELRLWKSANPDAVIVSEQKLTLLIVLEEPADQSS